MTSFIHFARLSPENFSFYQSKFWVVKKRILHWKSHDCSWFTLSERNKFRQCKGFSTSYSHCYFDLINCIGTITLQEHLDCWNADLSLRLRPLPDSITSFTHRFFLLKLETKYLTLLNSEHTHIHRAVYLARHRLKNQFTLKWAPHFSNAQKSIYERLRDRERACLKICTTWSL